MVADARINMRVSRDARELIAEAATAAGTDMTAFIVAAATQQARRVLLEERALQVTAAEAKQIMALLRDPGEPTEAHRRAHEQFQERVVDTSGDKEHVDAMVRMINQDRGVGLEQSP